MNNAKGLENATSQKVRQVFSQEELNTLTPQQEKAFDLMLGRAMRERARPDGGGNTGVQGTAVRPSEYPQGLANAAIESFFPKLKPNLLICH
jgi:hypothetical protein